MKCPDAVVSRPFDYTPIICALRIDIIIFRIEPNRFGTFGTVLIVIEYCLLPCPRSNPVKLSEEIGTWHFRFAIRDIFA